MTIIDETPAILSRSDPHSLPKARCPVIAYCDYSGSHNRKKDPYLYAWGAHIIQGKQRWDIAGILPPTKHSLKFGEALAIEHTAAWLFQMGCLTLTIYSDAPSHFASVSAFLRTRYPALRFDLQYVHGKDVNHHQAHRNARQIKKLRQAEARAKPQQLPVELRLARTILKNPSGFVRNTVTFTTSTHPVSQAVQWKAHLRATSHSGSLPPGSTPTQVVEAVSAWVKAQGHSRATLRTNSFNPREVRHVPHGMKLRRAFRQNAKPTTGTFPLPEWHSTHLKLTASGAQRTLLERIGATKCLTLGMLSRNVNVSQATILKHLLHFHEAGIIRITKRGEQIIIERSPP